MAGNGREQWKPLENGGRWRQRAAENGGQCWTIGDNGRQPGTTEDDGGW